ncbi:MAG: NADH-quinone oxidoreductase subunit A [Candidatus Brocadiae bacterium]|nr:NADH-quinone oxidoreductase subunit A [Candidatus Brocadiia bacterium]
MLRDYGPLFVYGLLVLATGAGALILSALLGPKRRRAAKAEPYECGVPLLDSSQGRQNIRFYLVALFFILFDIEIVFLIPYAVAHRSLGSGSFAAMAIFVAVLGAGLGYVWKRGALEWD